MYANVVMNFLCLLFVFHVLFRILLLLSVVEHYSSSPLSCDLRFLLEFTWVLFRFGTFFILI
jgi:hypothetical protein